MGACDIIRYRLRRRRSVPAEALTGSKILGLMAGAAALFAWLAEGVVHGRTQPFDDRLRMLVHGLSHPWLTAVMRGVGVIASPASLIMLGALAIVLFMRTGKSRTALLYLIVVGGAQALGESLKIVFHRVRPDTFFGVVEPGGFSFPSGHSVGSCAFFCVVAIFAAERTGSRARRWLYYLAAAIAIATVGFSRIYLGMHYPSDVLGGYTVAVLWLSIVAWFRSRRAPTSH
jgi:undecaprenyl-diphosphatase